MTPDKRIALSGVIVPATIAETIEVALHGECVGNGRRLGGPRLDCDAGCHLVPDLHCLSEIVVGTVASW